MAVFSMPEAEREPITLRGKSPMWQAAGWTVFRWSVIGFGLLGFAGSTAAVIGTGGITLSGQVVTGVPAIAVVTLACLVAGALFGSVWFLIFRTLALASAK